MPADEVVITGVGVVSPIGIGRGPFWSALLRGQSGIERIRRFDSSCLPVPLGAEVKDFDPKAHVRPRKSLKMMGRDAQLGVAAARQACEDAGIAAGTVDPDRFGVVLGADRICNTLQDSAPSYRRCIREGRFDFQRWGTDGLAATFPLNFLKVLPNMIASLVSIALDARGPNNTIHQAELSGLLAVSEAASVIQRGAADVMLAGGASSQMNLFDCVRRCGLGMLSHRRGDPGAAVRPFDAQRDGQVWGEGAAAFILENHRHARARGANVLARLVSWAAACETRHGRDGIQGTGLRRAIRLAMDRAGLSGNGLGHVNAHGLSTTADDRLEARVLHDEVPATPVIAAKSYFGNLGAAGAAMEMAVSVLSLSADLVPATLNYEHPDPNCPLQVIQGEPLAGVSPSALLLNWTPVGQAATAVLAGPD